jgi:putative resolvase
MKISIGKAAKLLGVTQGTLRRWESEGKLQADRTAKGHRRYDESKISGLKKRSYVDNKVTLGYARASSHDQKKDLLRQVELLETFCAANGWTFEIIQDLGSGLNYQKKGLKKLIKKICYQEIQRLVLTHKDRLLRFGSELIFSLCELFNVEVVIVNVTENTTYEDDLVQDVLEIITVFSARLYGARSRKNQKLLDSLKDAAKTL